MRKISLLLFLIMALSAAAHAQLVLVNGAYRVVALDREQFRVGVALPPDNPEVVQNWIYLKLETTGHLVDGRRLNANEVMEQFRPGQMLWISGGRRWDGGITVDAVWF
ncbi:MAG: hypothetical protein HY319_00745 [Armatimonadetes bacterium]|nr:hypothetical protein [Armatimonadota bacterium]